MKKTVLHSAHIDAGAKMVDFGGWHMPINYGSQIDEHHAVRQAVGVFDVSHMTVVDVHGPAGQAYLLRLLSNDVRKLKDGQALYSTMLNHDGGVIDDLIVYRVNDDHHRVVVNAATRDKDLAWMQQQMTGFDAELNERADLAMLAVQGPEAIARCSDVLGTALNDLQRFYALQHGPMFIGRTGYTGEDGVEIVLPESLAHALWRDLLEAGVQPCGLGARDTLRLEAGMHLYGQDMDETICPLECGLAWTVRKSDADFIGADALESIRAAGLKRKLIGLVLQDRGILRGGQNLTDSAGRTGVITSGGYSPSTGKAIAMAHVDIDMAAPIEVEIRGKQLPVKPTKLPFVRNGQSLIED